MASGGLEAVVVSGIPNLFYVSLHGVSLERFPRIFCCVTPVYKYGVIGKELPLLLEEKARAPRSSMLTAVLMVGGVIGVLSAVFVYEYT